MFSRHFQGRSKLCLRIASRIASDIRTKSAEEITKCYTVTRIGENKHILSIKIDECINREYRLYFDIKRQPDNTYAILGDVEIQIYAQYMGVFDKDMNYIPSKRNKRLKNG